MPDRLKFLLAPKRVLVVYQGTTAPAVSMRGAVDVDYAQADTDGRFTQPAAQYDLAVAFIDASVMLNTLRQLCTSQTARAVVMPGQVPLELADAAHVVANAAQVLLLGPHGFGLQLPPLGLNASAAPLAQTGGIALLSQSSSLTAAMLDWAADNHVGFSIVASCGAQGDTSLTSLLDYCAVDAQTQAIVLYLDEVPSGRLQVRRFMSALRAAASAKPVVVLKPTGRGEATEIPTVTLAQNELVFSTALARGGAVRVYFFIQLFSALKLLTSSKHPAGRQLAVLSNSSAAARLAADWGARVRVSVQTKDLAPHLPEPEIAAAWSRQIAQAAAEPDVDALMLMLSPQQGVDAACVAQLANALTLSGKPALACVLGDAQARPLRAVLENAQVPALRTPEAAVDAFGNLATFHYNQELLRQIPPPMAGKTSFDLRKARALIAQALASGTDTLESTAAYALLRALGIERALQVDPAQTDANAFAVELRIEAHMHPQFGPVLFFGWGGAAGELVGELASELAPLNRLLAQRLIDRSPAHRVLVRTAHPELLHLQLQRHLLALSEALCELPALVDVQIDPLRYTNGQLRIGAARLRLTQPPTAQDQGSLSAYAHMAIHPYPAALAQTALMKNGEFAGARYTLRPIRPEDAFPLQAFVRDLSSESRYMRFISHLRELSASMLVRYTQIDYDRELAFVAVIPDSQSPGADQIIGMAHWLRSRDDTSAEYALAVADGFQRQGIGSTLMKALEEQARAKTLILLEGFVLTENSAMLDLMRYLGYTVEPYPADPSMRRVFKRLQ
jgi:acetyltransferase